MSDKDYSNNTIDNLWWCEACKTYHLIGTICPLFNALVYEIKAEIVCPHCNRKIKLLVEK